MQVGMGGRRCMESEGLGWMRMSERVGLKHVAL